MAKEEKVIHFFVNGKKIETTQESLTGARIKELAGVQITDLLEELVDGNKPVAVNDEQTVEVKNKKFRTHPGGKDS